MMRIAIGAVVLLFAGLVDAQVPSGNRTFAVKHVVTGRELKIGRGFASTYRYEPVAQDAEGFLVEKLNAKGLYHVATLSGGCCLVTIELLELAQSQTVMKAGFDVSATVTVVDAGGQQIYFKGYRGEARATASSVKTMLNKAAEKLAENVANDPELLRLLNEGGVTRAAAPPPAVLVDVTIGSIPAGGEIEINEAFSGNTPSTFKLAPGDYRIAVTMERRNKWERSLKIDAAMSLTAELTPITAPAAVAPLVAVAVQRVAEKSGQPEAKPTVTNGDSERSEQATKPLKNDDIKKMVAAGFNDDTIATVIRSRACEFDTSVAALIDLKNAGVNERIMELMLARPRSTPARVEVAPTAPAASATPPPPPAVPMPIALPAPAAPAPVGDASETPAEQRAPSGAVTFVTTPSGARVQEAFLADLPASGKPGSSDVVVLPYQNGSKVLYWIPEIPGLELYSLVSESGRRFDRVKTSHPVLGAGGRHIAIAIGTPVSAKAATYKWDLLFDGQVIPCQADEIPRLVFSPDGRRLAFVVRYGDQSLVRVVGEADGPKYDWVGPPSFSPDSAHLIYAAGFATQIYVLIDQKVVSSHEVACSRALNVRPDDSAFSAFFSPNSSSWAVATTNCSGMQTYNINGKLEAESYGSLSPISFSPDGQHHAYLAVKLKHGMWTANKGIGVVVVDGQPSPDYEGIGLPPGNGTLRVLFEPNATIFGVSAPRYTADGKHLLYVARNKGGYVLMQDGEAGPLFDAILTDPVTAGGDRHIAYMAVLHKELLMVIDGAVTGLGSVVPYDDFSFIEWLGLAPGGKLVAILNKHGTMWSEDMHARRRILLDGKLGTQYDCLRMYSPAFSSDGRHFAYAVTGIKNKAVKGARQNVPRVIVDEIEGPEYTSIVFPVQRLEGGAAVYYAVKDGKLYRVTQQGRDDFAVGSAHQ